MNRLSKTKTGPNLVSLGLAMPDWMIGKRKPTLEEIEKFVKDHPNRKPAADKALIKALMEYITGL